MSDPADNPKFCRSCGAPVVFLWSPKNPEKKMIIDWSSVRLGDTVYDSKAGHIDHHATCPKADEWKKGRKK